MWPSLELGWLWPALVAAYAISVAAFVTLERRRPASTFAWILVLIFVPVVGIPIYLLIGRRRVRRLRRKHDKLPLQPRVAMRNMARIAELPVGIPERTRGLVRLAMRTAGAPIRRAHQVKLLPHMPEAYAAMYTAIAQARHRIHIEFYIWRDDETGRDLVARLAEAASRGVTVRVLYDDIGSFRTPRSLFDPLRDAGGHAEIFGKVSWGAFLRRGTRLDFRNHRKLVCVDASIGFMGGLNVGNEYRVVNEEGLDWRDLWMRIEGDAVLGLESTFIEDWQLTTGELIEPFSGVPGREDCTLAASPETAPASTGPLVQLLPSGPGLLASSVMATQFMAAISVAQQRCWICTPYFIPESSLSMLLRVAALRGVDVRVCIPARVHNDAPLVSLAAQSYFDDLLEAGCQIFEFQPGMLHAKYLIVDDAVCAVGSANFDLRSLHINYEITALFYDEVVTGELAAIFESTIAQSKAVTAADRADIGAGARFAEAFARVWSPLF